MATKRCEVSFRVLSVMFRRVKTKRVEFYQVTGTFERSIEISLLVSTGTY